MTTDAIIVDVDETNLAQHGFFCYKSKPKSIGYQQKLAWLQQRFAEGMRIKILYEGRRSVGFIEYIPGEYAWRVVNAPEFMLIHCLWVVGKAKGKGYGKRLLDVCRQEAQDQGRQGVAMVTSRGNWLAGPQFLEKEGFHSIDQAPPSFELWVSQTGPDPQPSFPTDWEARAARLGRGLTVLRSNQCPYIANAVHAAQKAGDRRGIPAQVIELHNRPDVQELSPSAYGLFGIVLDGQLISYHPLSEKDLDERIQSLGR